MTRKQAIEGAALRLSLAGASDAKLDAQWMAQHVTGIPRLNLLMEGDRPLTPAEAAAYEALVARRERGEPLQYVLGEGVFMGHTFRTDRRALIPRSDTEPLCEAAMARLRPGMALLDIGTGSGALAISLALHCPGAMVTGLDISGEALSLARENGAALGGDVRWVQGDLFPEDGLFDLIVSNPPYIESGELPHLQREVGFEPPLALDGGPDGLSFYRRIVAGLAAHLKPGGSLLLEIGDTQGPGVLALLAGHFDKTHIMLDLAGRDRVAIGDGYAG